MRGVSHIVHLLAAAAGRGADAFQCDPFVG